MPGNSIFYGIDVPLARFAAPIEVYRLTGYRFETGHPPTPEDVPSAFEAGNPKAELLPNIVCLKIRRNQGIEAGFAEFRYRMDNSSAINVDGEWPTSSEQIIGFDVGGRYVARTDDRIFVVSYADDGRPQLLFDGFVEMPSSSITSRSEDVRFTALATPVRCLDYPLWGGVFRNEDSRHSKVNDKASPSIKIHFNPVGAEGVARRNATDEGDDGETEFRSRGGDLLKIPHAVFLDPDFCEDQKIGRFWTVAMAARYILARGNTHQAFVLNPGVDDDDSFPVVRNLESFIGLELLLDSWSPKDDQFLDFTDPDSFDKKPIILRDVDVTGLPWPEALARVIEPYGFRFVFRLFLNQSGHPDWLIDFYREADYIPEMVRPLMLQPYDSNLNPWLTNVGQMNLTRDMSDHTNEFGIEFAPDRHEVALVLSPLFDIDPADCATPAALEAFKDTNDPLKPVGPKYREYGFDETGEGHWDFKLNARSYTIGSLAEIFGGPKEDEEGNPIPMQDREKNYLKRRRKASGKLLTRDNAVADPETEEDAEEDDEDDQGITQGGLKGKRANARLFLCTGYQGSTPGIWDGTRVLYPVKGWRLLDDRIGIRLIASDVDGWDTGNKKISFGVNANSGGGKVRGVTAQSKVGETRFTLVLLCVIEGDDTPVATAKSRLASPSRWTVKRYVEGIQKYRKDIIHGPTPYVNQRKQIVVRDDTRAAKADAKARRVQAEMPPVAGGVVIPRLTQSYAIGHRLSGIVGRGISFRMNAGNSQGESSRYPLIVGLEYNFGDSSQTTTLILGDRRSDAAG